MKNSFTLLELLIVIAVIAILSGILMPAAMQAWSKAYVEKAKAQLSALEVALGMYKTDIGYYPEDDGASTCTSLVTALTTAPSPVGNWHGPYMSFKEEEISSGNFLDPWGTSYIYDKDPSSGNTTSYNLSSYGADGASGGTGNDEDITNW